MPNELAKIEPIRALKPEDTTPRWPQWLASSVAALTDDHVSPKIPASLALLDGQRLAVQRHVEQIDRICKPGPVARTGSAVGALLMAFPSTQGGEGAAEMRMEAYRMALDDLPAWTIERAARMWLRGENSSGGENYAFAPSPPQLRRLAQLAFTPVRAQRSSLLRLLRAKPDEEYPEPHREVMRAKLARMIPDAVASLRQESADDAA